MHTKGGKSQTEETENARQVNGSEWKANVVSRDGWCSFNGPTADISVRGEEVVCTQRLSDSHQSSHHLVEVAESPRQPDNRTHSVKADKGWTNTHQHTHTHLSLAQSLQTVEEDVMKERRGADKLCVCAVRMNEKVSDREKVTLDDGSSSTEQAQRQTSLKKYEP